MRTARLDDVTFLTPTTDAEMEDLRARRAKGLLDPGMEVRRPERPAGQGPVRGARDVGGTRPSPQGSGETC